MLSATFLLTLATLAGLAIGFAREWLFVDAWGANQFTDAIILALFLPEAVRMTLAAGILNAAALPLYHQQSTQKQLWLNALGNGLIIFSIIVSLVLLIFSEWWVRLIGPGLSESGHATAVTTFCWLVWCIPAFFLHGFFTIQAHLQQQFFRAGLGSLLFNLPPVLWLLIHKEQTTAVEFAISCIAGSLAMVLVMLPYAWLNGWRPHHSLPTSLVFKQFSKRLGPLLLSNAASHGLVLFERILASLLGEGMVTWINLARKLVNLPLVGLMALNQVLLSRFSAKVTQQRLRLLRHGLAIIHTLTLPTAIGLVAASPTFIHFLFPDLPTGMLSFLLASFAAPLIFGAWNALLARYAYANSNTSLPLHCELTGNAVHIVALLILFQWLGAAGFAIANALAVLTTCCLLLYRQQLISQVPWKFQSSTGVLGLSFAAIWLYPLPPGWLQLILAVCTGSVCLLLLVLQYKTWGKSNGDIGG